MQLAKAPLTEKQAICRAAQANEQHTHRPDTGPGFSAAISLCRGGSWGRGYSGWKGVVLLIIADTRSETELYREIWLVTRAIALLESIVSYYEVAAPNGVNRFLAS